MSHGYRQKEPRQWSSFVHATVKHEPNFIPNQVDPAFHGKAPVPSGMLGKKLVPTSSLDKFHANPSGQKSLMYGWGHGLPVVEPSDVAHSVHNRRTLQEVNNLDFGNYYKFTK